ncbi:hypothetical protein AB1E18_015316 [Capra hircus]
MSEVGGGREEPPHVRVEVRNRFKGLDLIDTVPDELWKEVHDIVQETGIKTILMEKKCKKATLLSGEALQITVKRREVKGKGEKERYKHLNAEFQRIASRDKKSFFSDQCNEIEENNRMEYIMRIAGLEETQAGINIARRNINNLRYADDTTLMAESEEELKGLLMKVKVESEKVGLKLNIQKTKIMASGSIASWEIDGETVETVSDFIFGGSKITADGDCSHEIKRRLLLGRKFMTNLDSIFKSREIALLTKVQLDKAMVFPVVMYGCERWTVKKAES